MDSVLKTTKERRIEEIFSMYALDDCVDSYEEGK